MSAMRKLFLMLFSTVYFLSASAQSQLQVVNLKCEYQENPSGIESKTPTFSWQMTSSERNEKQTSYEILVASSAEMIETGKTDMWNSGQIKSEQSIHVKYAGKPLIAGKTYYWKLRVWNKTGKPSGWSKVAWWQMGLLTASDWGNAKWLALTPWSDSMRITPGLHVPHNDPNFGKKGSGNHPLPMFRKAFTVKRKLTTATAFISGLGHYELSVNGKNATKNFLAPAWTDYDDYSYYNAIDLTKQFKTGENAIGVMLGNGFYNVPNERYRKVLVAYGAPKMICKIVLEYDNGTKEEIISDESWRVASSPITFTSIFGGEDYDATLEQKNWNQPGFDDSGWKKPIIVQKQEKLLSQVDYPMAVMDTFSVAKITNAGNGIWVYDMAQNVSAIPQITVKGARGKKVKITPGELIHDNGLVNQSASGDPHFYNYTLKGEGVESWQPRFTYYGFRYIQIEGAVPEGEANPSNLPEIVGLRSLHVRNSTPQTGTFHSSNELFNQIFTLINWAIKSNITHVMTDCPHREKLGWMEEMYLMGNSVQFNLDMALLNKKLFKDMESAQLDNGLIPDIVPEYVPFDGGFRDSPEWGSAGVILPWYCYQWYGDKTILSDHYEMMKKYVAYLEGKSKDHILMHGLGDWFDMGPGRMGESQLTPAGLTPTATYYYDVTILAQVATLLGKTDDAVHYQKLAPEIKKAFNRKFYNRETKQYGTGSQTANAMALYLNLTETSEKNAVYQSLIKGLEDNNYVLTAGDVGYHYLVKVLSEAGAVDVLNKMNNRNDVPGYGFQLAHGATALTESWPALRNVSNNHLMLGHLMEWFYEGIGGIKQEENSVGYQKLVIQPQFPGDMKDAETTYQSPYGKIATKWRKEEHKIFFEVEIPVNTSARIVIPFSDINKITEAGKSLASQDGISVVKDAIETGSGKYSFVISD
jgi:alpha-L-rhamnosidase